VPEVLRIIGRLNVGGPARHVLRLDAPLRRRGWRTVLATGSPDPGEGDLLDEARAAGLDVRVVPELRRDVHPARDARALLALRRLVRELRPDVVHTHTAKAGVLGRLAAGAVSPAPARVHTFHGHVLAGYFGPLRSALWRSIERALARRSDALIAVAPQVRDELVQHHGVGRREQYRIVPPGVDFERVRPDPAGGAELRARLGLARDAVLAGCVGRLAPVKDTGALLAAFAAARERCPRLALLVVGDGPDAARLAPALAAPGVAWLPPRRELCDVYAALDLLLLPSRAEGCPQVLVEALAAGVPVLASAVGGVPWLVRDGVDGRLVPPGDATALAGVLAELACDDAQRRRLGAAAARTDLAAHSAEAVAGALADVYAAVTRPAVRRAPLESGAAGAQTRAACTSSS
jgi:glycosyltransferase involved in cell wall biosynthesis